MLLKSQERPSDIRTMQDKQLSSFVENFAKSLQVTRVIQNYTVE